MRAAVERDSTTREIEIKVADGPIIDVTQSWQRKVRKIQVDRITVRIIDGQTWYIGLNGGMRRVDGTTSDYQRGNTGWSANNDGIASAPEWVQAIWRQAPAGITEWTLEEV